MLLARVGLALLAGAAIAGCGGAGNPGATPALPAIHHRTSGSSPIQHVIIVIQENRSFDDLFATFPKADGTTTGQGEPMPHAEAATCSKDNQHVVTQSNTTIPLTEVSLVGAGFPKFKNGSGKMVSFGEGTDLPHVWGWYDSLFPFLDQYDNENMDGFDLEGSGANGDGSTLCTYPYQYVNPSAIKEYWDLAQQYVLADHTFQTQGSGSFTAHQDLIAGGTPVNYGYGGYSEDSIIDNPSYWPWGCDAPQGVVTSLITTNLKFLLLKGPFPCFSYTTMRDLLDAQSVSWKYYAVLVKGGNAGLWSAYDAIKAVRYSKEWTNNVTTSPNVIFQDIKAGNLPAVSWVTPDGQNSDHPDEKGANGKYVDHGPSWVANIVNSVGESQYWNSSAVIVLWDDWGGFYDHVAPPCLYQSQCRDNQGGLGFRVPMIIVSPYVTAHVEHTQYEFGSILKYIEENWGLPVGGLGTTDKRATSIGNVFNYDQKPRKFKAIPASLPLSFFLHQKPSSLPPDPE
ncbi:MAG: alkaline phosphatase family protein [Candidatus Cybelea sp.]